ncbi:MAG TPA: hypothetical protein VI168_17760 [Croceibacterium sp.]
MRARRLVQSAAAAALLLTASPAAASDFTPFRVVLFATYYAFAFGLWLAVLYGVRVNKGARVANPIAAALAAALFAPSAAWSPNHFIALPVVLMFGSELGRPLLTVASLIATGIVVWGLLRLRSGQPPEAT